MKDAVLVACPTYAGKEYCLDEWVNAYKSQTYSGVIGSLMMDNTRNSDGFTKLINEKGIRGVHMDPFDDFEKTFHTAWQIIHQEAVIEGYEWVFSVEADTIVPANALELMMDMCKLGKMEIITHTYPMHLTDQAKNGRTSEMNPKRFVYNELGCCLMSTRLLGLALADASRRKNFTDSLFQSAAFYLTGWGTMTNALDIQHLDGYHMEFQQFVARDVEEGQEDENGRWCPLSKEAVLESSGYNVVFPPSIAEDYKKLGAKIDVDGKRIPEEPGTESTGKGIKFRVEGNGHVADPEGASLEK